MSAPNDSNNSSKEMGHVGDALPQHQDPVVATPQLQVLPPTAAGTTVHTPPPRFVGVGQKTSGMTVATLSAVSSQSSLSNMAGVSPVQGHPPAATAGIQHATTASNSNSNLGNFPMVDSFNGSASDSLPPPSLDATMALPSGGGDDKNLTSPPSLSVTAPAAGGRGGNGGTTITTPGSVASPLVRSASGLGIPGSPNHTPQSTSGTTIIDINAAAALRPTGGGRPHRLSGAASLPGTDGMLLTRSNSNIFGGGSSTTSPGRPPDTTAQANAFLSVAAKGALPQGADAINTGAPMSPIPDKLPDIPNVLRPKINRTDQEAFKKIHSSLEHLLEENEQTDQKLRPWSHPMLREWYISHGFQCIITSFMLLIATCFAPSQATIFCAVVTVVVYIVFCVVEALFVWARSVELRSRCLKAITEHLKPGNGFIAGNMTGIRGMSGIHALRAQHVVRGGKLQMLPKALLLKDDLVLNAKTGKYESFPWSIGDTKLYDCLRYMLTSQAQLLPKLTDVQRPPRFPNLRQNFEEEEDASSDESDTEESSEVRSLVPGGSTPTVTMAMEWCTHRLLYLGWLIALPALVFVGYLRGLVMGEMIEEVLFIPSIAVIGLIPLNAFLLHRVLLLLSNAALFNSIEYLKRQRSMYNFLNRDEKVPIPIFQTLRRAVKCLQMNNLDKPLCFARNSVETLGFCTVLAPLDFEGILTDIVPVPVAVLFINRNEGESSSSSSDDDDKDGGFLSEQKIAERRDRRKALRLQVRRAKFQQKRFTQLELTSSAQENLPTEFLNDGDVTQNKAGLNPLCLCVVIHSVFSKHYTQTPESQTQRHLDKTILWSRCCHWMSRAAGFADSTALRYRLIRRVHMVRTLQSPKRTEQICGLLLTPDGETLHLFILGSPSMLVERCSSYWTGDEIEEFDSHEKAQLLTVGMDQWEKARTLECVACAHRVLPKRYNKFLLPGHHTAASHQKLPTGDSEVLEHYYRDGQPVEDVCDEMHRRAHMRRGEYVRSHTSHVRSKSSEYVHDPHFEESEDKPALRPGNFERRLSVGDKPVSSSLEADEVLSADNAVTMMMSHDNTFLGMIGLRDFARPNVESAVSTLADAGVRFTHFGHSTEAHTKAFGTRVGLETDFNSCVSLKDESVALDPKSIRAQLPFGIKSIRKHLLYVDHIPLQVSLFSHSRSSSTRSMVSILQDNHDVVCVLGSGINHGHMRSFIQADIAITTTPTTLGSVLEKADILNRPMEDPLIDLSHKATGQNLRSLADLFGSVCAMKLPPTSNALPMLTVLIRESRLLVKAISNAVEYTLHASCFIVLMHLTCLLLGLPLFISSTGTLWILNVSIPIMACGCTYTDKSPVQVMKLMPNKHNSKVRLSIFAHTARNFAITFTPTVIFVLVLGMLVLSHAADQPSHAMIWVNYRQHVTEPHLDVCRGFLTMVITYLLAFHALSYVSRHQLVTLWLRKPNPKFFCLLTCYRWMMFTLGGMLATFLFIAAASTAPFSDTKIIPTGCIIVALFYPVIIILLDYPLKRYRAKRSSDIQKFRRLFFQTRLGMHSPKGDYEPSVESESHGGSHHSASGHHHEGGHHGQGGDQGRGASRKNLRERLDVFLQDWIAIQHGRMERNSVVLDD